MMYTNAQVALMATVTEVGPALGTLTTAEKYLRWLDSKDREREQ